MAEKSPQEQLFRAVMSRFATGVTVVTTMSGGRPFGLTVSSFCSVSLEPRLVLVSIDQAALSRPHVADSGVFAVNILSSQQQFLADRFAGRGPLVDGKFDGVPYRTVTTGSPILEGALGWVDCRVVDRVPAGDHVLFIGEVVETGIDESAEPLVYFHRRFTHLAP